MRLKHRPGRQLTMIALTGSALVVSGPLAAQSIAPTRDELTRAQPSTAPPRPTLNIVGGMTDRPAPGRPPLSDVSSPSRVQFNNLSAHARKFARRGPFAGT